MKKTNYGFSLLEFVITLPVTLLFLFGTTDMMRVMSAQTAIDSGTESALRCLSPINGDCNKEVSDNYTKMYDVFSLNQTNSYLIDRYRFSATANTLKANQYETKATANILKSGTLKLKKFQTAYNELSYKANLEAKFLLMTQSLPQIIGDAVTLENQRFVLKDNKNIKYTPTIENSSNFSMTIAKNENEAKSFKEIEFSIPAIEGCDPTLPCFLASDIDKNNLKEKTPNYGKTCPNAFSWKDGDTFGANNEYTYQKLENAKIACEKTPILLFIEGDSSIAGDDSAKVDIEITNSNGKILRDLGGRVFDKNSSASLVARGAEKESYSDTLKNRYGDGEISFHQAIQLNYNKTYKIRFKLKRLNNSYNSKVTWTFKKLKIFTPQYALMTLEDQCQNEVFLSTPQDQLVNECNAQNVSKKAKMNLDFKVSTYGKGTPSKKIIYGDCSLGKESKEEILKKNNVNVALLEAFVETDPKACNKFEDVKYNCSTNFGTKDKSKYKDLCPATDIISNYVWKDFYTPSTNIADFSLEKIDLGNITWNKENCNDTKEYLQNDWKTYNDLSLKTSKIGSTFVSLDNDKFCENLDKIKSNYSCADFSFETETVIPKTSEQLQTLLSGTHEGMKCSWENDNWKNIVYQEILANWDFTNNSCFDMRISRSGAKASDELPSDDCSTYLLSSNQSKEDKKFLGNFAENSFPSECNETLKTCNYVFTGFKNKVAIQQKDEEKNLKNAKIVASNNIHKLFPNSKENCDDIYCVNFIAKETSDKVFFDSKINVPIYTLFGKTVQISSGSSKDKELF